MDVKERIAILKKLSKSDKEDRGHHEIRSVIGRIDMIMSLSNEDHIKKICEIVKKDLIEEFFDDMDHFKNPELDLKIKNNPNK